MTITCGICGREFASDSSRPECPACGVIVEIAHDGKARAQADLFGDPLALFLFELTKAVSNQVLADALGRTRLTWTMGRGNVRGPDAPWMVQHCRMMAKALRKMETEAN